MKNMALLEFILLDPEKNEFIAYVREKGKLVRTHQPDGFWESPELGINFRIEGDEIVVRHAHGEPFKTFAEIKSEKETLAAEKETLTAEKDALAAEKHRALEAKDAAMREIEHLKKRLRELGENPD